MGHIYSGAPSETKTGNFLCCKGAFCLIICEKWRGTCPLCLPPGSHVYKWSLWLYFIKSMTFGRPFQPPVSCAGICRYIELLHSFSRDSEKRYQMTSYRPVVLHNLFTIVFHCSYHITSSSCIHVIDSRVL